MCWEVHKTKIHKKEEKRTVVFLVFQHSLYIGHKECTLLNVHEKVMKESESDMVDSIGSISATIQSRKAKAQGIITGIMAILDEIPLGRHKMDIAMN